MHAVELLKVNKKGRVFISVSNFRSEDQEKISTILNTIDEYTDEAIIQDAFKDIPCKVKSKSYFIKRRRYSTFCNVLTLVIISAMFLVVLYKAGVI